MQIDEYVLDVLMRDLVGHDRAPSAYLVFLQFWRHAARGVARLSLQQLAEATGLSKSGVQAGVRRLLRRRLVRVAKASATATPEYRLLRPWRLTADSAAAGRRSR